MTVLILLTSAAAFVVGSVLLCRGMRGALMDRRPRCRRCGYDVTGFWPTPAPQPTRRCPECGRRLTAFFAVRIGERRRTPKLVAWGALTTLFSSVALGALAWTAAAGARSAPVMPSWLLLLRLRSADEAMSDAALVELAKRIKGQALGRDAQARLIDIGLDRQADGRTWLWSKLWSQFLESAWRNGALDEARRRRFLAASLRADVEIPESLSLRPGGATTILLGWRALGQPSSTLDLWVTVSIERVEIEGVVLESRRPAFGPVRWRQGADPAAFPCAAPDDAALVGGAHTLVTTVRFEVREGPAPAPFLDRPEWAARGFVGWRSPVAATWTETIRRDVRLVVITPPDLTVSPSSRQTLDVMPRIALRSATAQPGPADGVRLALAFEVTSAPLMDLCFEPVVRCFGRRWSAGDVMVVAAGTTRALRDGVEPAPDGAPDQPITFEIAMDEMPAPVLEVLLVPAPERSMRLGIDEIWPRLVRFEDVFPRWISPESDADGPAGPE